MISLLLKLMGDPNEKKVKKIMGIIDHINSLEPEFEKLSDEELRAKTERIRPRFGAAFSLWRRFSKYR